LLSELGAAALAFDIYCIVPNLGDRGSVKSDIQIAILKRLRAAGIDLSPPQDVRLAREAVTAPPQVKNA
jgi:small-conductance mechanosensitive channel